MDTQNVSAQLYMKQLPYDGAQGRYNCEDIPGNVLSTCIDGQLSDEQIENAFQKQLNLSEYYKSPMVFETVKQDFMDRTMESQNIPTNDYIQEEPSIPSVDYNIPVGPTDFLRRFTKEGFGGSSFIIIAVIVAVIAIILMLVKFNVI
jgi:hypothetical protein